MFFKNKNIHLFITTTQLIASTKLTNSNEINYLR